MCSLPGAALWKDSLIKSVMTAVEVWGEGDDDEEEGQLVCGHTLKKGQSEKVAPGKGSSGRVGWGGLERKEAPNRHVDPEPANLI